MEIKTAFWAAALIRRAELAGASGFVTRKGDPDEGDVLVKVTRAAGLARLYGLSRDRDGAAVWLDLSGGALGEAEPAIDAFIERRAKLDPDLWAIEIEDKEGRHFLTEPVIAPS